MSEKYLHVRMSDGSVWAIPARFIAEVRARFYAANDTNKGEGPEFEQVFQEEVEFALSNRYEVADWAAGNMNWADVKDHARKIKDAPPLDFEEEWLSAETWVEEESK